MSPTALANRFQADVRRVFCKQLNLVCHSLNKNVPISSLHPETASGENLEIDLLVVIGKCVILVETTRQKNKNRSKISRFIRHSELVRMSPLDMRGRFKLLGDLPKAVLDNLDAVTEWRYLYIGTSTELIDKELTPQKYPDTDKLSIFNGENWQYLRELSRLIGRFAQYEFLAAINVGPAEMEDASLGGGRLVKLATETTNRVVAPDTGNADLYLLSFRPNELLKVGRVLRYRGQPIAIESEDAGAGYQRILIPEKLKSIATFISGNTRAAFPSTLTVVLSANCMVEATGGESGARNVVIPQEYASIDVIDGQHRLFAYAQDNVPEEVRETNRLLVTAIKFGTEDAQEINRNAAQTFVSINSTHTRVKKALIDMISYDVLGETSTRAIAAKILLDCTRRPNKALSRIFRTSEFTMVSKEELPPIPTVLVVDELTRYFNVEQYRQNGKRAALERTFDCSIEELEEPGVLVEKGTVILERYFSVVKRVFPRDWGNRKSRMMCAKYLGGFVRLLRTFTEHGLTMEQIEGRLGAMRIEIVRKFHAPDEDPESVIVFDDKSTELPTKRETSPGKMYELLWEACGCVHTSESRG